MCSSSFCLNSPYLIWEIILGIIVLGIVIYLAVKQISQPPVLGRSEFIGQVGEVRENLNPEGQIFVNGEVWQALSASRVEIKKGEKVKVLGTKNFRLIVEKYNEEG